MVEPSNNTDHGNGSCPYPNTSNIEPIEYTGIYNVPWRNSNSKKFNWTEEQQGLLLGCFFYGYTISVGLLGLTADIIGARYLIGFSLGMSSALSLFYELFANWGFGYLVALRTLQGAVQGGMFPPQTSLWGKWAPQNERTTLLGISNSIAILGNLISNSLSAVICEYIGWRWVFYIYGIAGIGIAIIWTLYVRNAPSEMPWEIGLEYNVYPGRLATLEIFNTYKRSQTPSMNILNVILPYLEQKFRYDKFHSNVF